MSSSGNPLFSSVQAPASRMRWESFAVSLTFQAVGLAALLLFSILNPRIAPPALLSGVELVAPELTLPPPPAPKAAVAPPVMPKPPEAHAVVVRTVEQKIPAPQVRELPRPERLQRKTPVAAIPRPQMAAPKFESRAVPALPVAKSKPKIVAMNTFGGSSAAPTLKKTPIKQVQTGGFGDPNGAPAGAHSRRRANIAPAGGFDLPQGAGRGNGSGGVSGHRGTVASAGFGNGPARQAASKRGKTAKRSALLTASFSNAAAAAVTSRSKKPARQVPAAVPVSIHSKPTPVYTPEARALKIEGEVLLKVIFTADGQVHVLNVVRGLGHGLDESARKAARGIRFTPAMRDGHPVDSHATLHVVFQLS